MTPEMIEVLLQALIPLLGAAGLYLFNRFLGYRDIELTEEGKEIARIKITAAIERMAGAIRSGQTYNFEDGVKYVEQRMRESMEELGMTVQEVQETLDVEIQKQESNSLF